MKLIKKYEINTENLHKGNNGNTTVKVYLVQDIEKLIKFHYDCHKRYGKMTDESAMRFEDMLKEIRSR